MGKPSPNNAVINWDGGGVGEKGAKTSRLHKQRPEGYTTACHLCLHYTELHRISAG